MQGAHIQGAHSQGAHSQEGHSQGATYLHSTPPTSATTPARWGGSSGVGAGLLSKKYLVCKHKIEAVTSRNKWQRQTWRRLEHQPILFQL